MTKYHSQKMVVDGINFDSKKEAQRWCELRLLERAGVIQNLQRQVKYTLIPSQKVDGRSAERECAYIADFVYTEKGETVVEDTKGFRTPDYVIKRKLMLWVHGISIREV
jgi:hypothetical protein